MVRAHPVPFAAGAVTGPALQTAAGREILLCAGTEMDRWALAVPPLGETARAPQAPARATG